MQNIGINLQNFLNQSTSYNISLYGQNQFTQMDNTLNNEQIVDNKNIIYKRNILFRSENKKSMILTVPFGTSVEKAIEKYFERNPNLNRIQTQFVYNGMKIKHNEKTPIEEYFVEDGSSVFVIK